MNHISLVRLALAITLFAAGLAVAPRTASPAVPDSDLAASWWVETRDAHVIGRLNFVQDADVAGEFAVTGAVMIRLPLEVSTTRGCRRVELLNVAETSRVALGPRGHLKGKLVLTSSGAEPCTGTLEIIRGRDRPAFGRNAKGELDETIIVRRLSLRARLTIGTQQVRRIVSLRGVKLDAATKLGRWQGTTPSARVRGRRIASNTFGLDLKATTDPLGFPFLDLHASGAVLLNGARRNGVDLRGVIAVACSRRGLVRLDAKGALADELGVGWGRTRHVIADRFATGEDLSPPQVTVYVRMTPPSGKMRSFALTAALTADPTTGQ